MDYTSILQEILRAIQDSTKTNYWELILGFILNIIASLLFYYLISRRYERAKDREDAEKKEIDSKRNKLLSLVSQMESLVEEFDEMIRLGGFNGYTVNEILERIRHIHILHRESGLAQAHQDLIHNQYTILQQRQQSLIGGVSNTYANYQPLIANIKRLLRTRILEVREEAIRLL